MNKLVFLFLSLQLVSCLTGPCEELPQYELSTISFKIKEGMQDVFVTDDARKSLQVFKLQNGQPVSFNFYSAPGQKDVSNFSIADSDFDLLAREALTCSGYILKYKINEIDTLQVCSKIKYFKKCDSTELDSIAVYWNGVLMSYSDYTATITK